MNLCLKPSTISANILIFHNTTLDQETPYKLQSMSNSEDTEHNGPSAFEVLSGAIGSWYCARIIPKDELTRMKVLPVSLIRCFRIVFKSSHLLSAHRDRIIFLGPYESGGMVNTEAATTGFF
ncbi:hypothetical protein JTE90_017557 [Oedothorax gibbosus]|uniref:Uncharacterized protein n=1 Tax=Oedothorax gibbosus TaxID=931172 RepID=A0AAV6UN45_9ARAC|nr:hypothetical protein JTE90_017557 [Oedothorax gibbosus]